MAGKTKVAKNIPPPPEGGGVSRSSPLSIPPANFVKAPADALPEKHEFSAGRKYPFTWALVIIFTGFVLSILLLLFVTDAAYFAGIWLAVMLLVIMFGIWPLFILHRMTAGGLTVGHPFHRLTIPASNIKEICTADEDVPLPGTRYLRRRKRLYIVSAPSYLVCVELRDPVEKPFSSAQPVHTLVLSVDNLHEFLGAAQRIMGVHVSEDKKCPECRRPLEAEKRTAALAPAARPTAPRIEYIFLIHEDGRLVFQYTGGRLQVASSSISGMLVVIQDFIRDAFKTDGGSLRKLEHGDLTVIIESGKFLFLAVVISGQEYPDTLRESMKRTLKEIEHDYGDILRVWEGRTPDGIGKVLSQILWS